MSHVIRIAPKVAKTKPAPSTEAPSGPSPVKSGTPSKPCCQPSGLLLLSSHLLTSGTAADFSAFADGLIFTADIAFPSCFVDQVVRRAPLLTARSTFQVLWFRPATLP